MENKSERISYIDYLKVLATFCVIVIHVCATAWYDIDSNSSGWKMIHLYDSLARWCVPAFVMASGALFLSRDIPIKELYRKYILRLALAYIGWAVFYGIFSSRAVVDVMVHTITGHYHLWFLPMLIGLYMLIPVFRLLVQKENALKYSIALLVLFSLIIPSIMNLRQAFLGENAILDAADQLISSFGPVSVAGFSVYYLSGYYLYTHKLSHRKKRFTYVLGAVGFLYTFFVTISATRLNGETTEVFYDYLSINVFMMTIAVFIAFQSLSYKNSRKNRIVAVVSKYCFTVYLVHPVMINLLNRVLGLTVTSFHPGLSVLVLALLVLALSLCFAACVQLAWKSVVSVVQRLFH